MILDEPIQIVLEKMTKVKNVHICKIVHQYHYQYLPKLYFLAFWISGLWATLKQIIFSLGKLQPQMKYGEDLWLH